MGSCVFGFLLTDAFLMLFGFSMVLCSCFFPVVFASFGSNLLYIWLSKETALFKEQTKAKKRLFYS